MFTYRYSIQVFIFQQNSAQFVEPHNCNTLLCMLIQLTEQDCSHQPALMYIIPCPSIDSIMRLMTICGITGKIIRTAITVHMHTIMTSSHNFRFKSFTCLFNVRFLQFLVKVKLTVLLSCACALPVKAVPGMTYTVSGGTLNPTHSHTH